MYNTIARVITGLPKWIPLWLLYSEAGMPPPDLLLTKKSMRYGVWILLTKDDHPCKKSLLELMRMPPRAHDNSTGLQRIADPLAQAIGTNDPLARAIWTNDPLLEDGRHHSLPVWRNRRWRQTLSMTRPSHTENG